MARGKFEAITSKGVEHEKQEKYIQNEVGEGEVMQILGVSVRFFVPSAILLGCKQRW